MAAASCTYLINASFPMGNAPMPYRFFTASFLSYACFGGGVATDGTLSMDGVSPRSLIEGLAMEITDAPLHDRGEEVCDPLRREGALLLLRRGEHERERRGEDLPLAGWAAFTLDFKRIAVTMSMSLSILTPSVS